MPRQPTEHRTIEHDVNYPGSGAGWECGKQTMKTHHYSLILILIALLAIGGRVWAEPDPIYAQSQPLALRGVAANATVIPRYGKVELTLDLTATYVNPFDPSQIDVEADFTSPNGAHRQIPGFLYQDFNRSLNETGAEALSPASTPVWMVRFAPDRVGTWQYTVTVRDPSGIVRAKPATLTVTDSSNPGFVMVSHRNPSAFAFDGEKPYFPVGEDMCWGGGKETYDYETWMPKLHYDSSTTILTSLPGTTTIFFIALPSIIF